MTGGNAFERGMNQDGVSLEHTRNIGNDLEVIKQRQDFVQQNLNRLLKKGVFYFVDTFPSKNK